jgi:hypothetical protein
MPTACAAYFGFREQQGQRRHQQSAYGSGHDVELRDEDVVVVHQVLRWHVFDRQLQLAHLRAEHQLRQPFDEEGQADGRHEQRDFRLVDQRPQHHAFYRQPKHDHHRHSDRQCDPQRHPKLVHHADAGQRGEVHHRSLGEIEYAGGFVDQHKTNRHQRVHHAGEQAANQHLEEEVHEQATPR